MTVGDNVNGVVAHMQDARSVGRGRLRGQGFRHEAAKIATPDEQSEAGDHGVRITIRQTLGDAPAMQRASVTRIDEMPGGGGVQPVVGIVGAMGDALAKRLTRLDNGDVELGGARTHQLNGGGSTGEAAADDDDLFGEGHALAIRSGFAARRIGITMRPKISASVSCK